MRILIHVTGILCWGGGVVRSFISVGTRDIFVQLDPDVGTFTAVAANSFLSGIFQDAETFGLCSTSYVFSVFITL
jgi:hypothetical protein